MIEPGTFKHVPVGDIDVWALVDGSVELPLALFPAAAEPGADASFGPGPFSTAVNCFAIRTGGTLHLVANAHLPYEAPLRAAFRGVDLVAAEGGYKLFEARK